MHRHWLIPDWDPGLTLAHLPLEPLLGRGIKVLLLDVDRTLLPGRDVQLPAPMRRWAEHASRLLHIHLISNNPSRQRIQAVAEQLNVTYTSSASKPRSGAIRRVIGKLPNAPAEIAMVGDRVFTDVLAGNRLGLYTVLVRPPRPDGTPCSHDRVQRLERNLGRFFGAMGQ
tara:strand:- start:21 stop:530 length:510 start_codon:yes stop_codon:yes gene_type:complete